MCCATTLRASGPRTRERAPAALWMALIFVPLCPPPIAPHFQAVCPAWCTATHQELHTSRTGIVCEQCLQPPRSPLRGSRLLATARAWALRLCFPPPRVSRLGRVVPCSTLQTAGMPGCGCCRSVGVGPPPPWALPIPPRQCHGASLLGLVACCLPTAAFILSCLFRCPAGALPWLQGVGGGAAVLSMEQRGWRGFIPLWVLRFPLPSLLLLWQMQGTVGCGRLLSPLPLPWHPTVPR